jgi:hypothetical protein
VSANTNNQTQMTDTENSEAPAQESGADDNTNANLSIEDLAVSFVEKVESETEDESTTEATEDVTESEVAEAEEDEDEEIVLSQSSEEEDSDDEDEDDEAEEHQPKSVQKLLKQVSRLTARSKGAEEEVAALKDQIQNLKSEPSAKNQPATPALEEVQSLEDLAKLEAEARAAKKWSLQNLGKMDVEIDGRIYEDDEIREILTQSSEYLDEKIPQRAEYLRQKEGWDQDTQKVFPYISKASGSDYEDYIQVRENPLYKQMLDNLPNGDFVAATLLAGIQAVQAKQKAKPAKKTKTPPTDVGDVVAPPVENKEARQRKNKEAILGQGNVSVDQFAQYLS